MKKGPKTKSAAQQTALAAAKAAIKETKFIGFVPYGQGGKMTQAALRAQRDEWIERQQKDEWPSEVPSFELWAQMTAYDHAWEYQRVMASLLGQPSIGHAVKAEGLAAGDYYNKGAKGKCFVRPVPSGYKFEAVAVGGNTVKTVHCSPTCGPLTDMWGVGTRNFSGASPGFPTKEYETNPAYGVYGSLDWRVKFNLRYGPEGLGGVKPQSAAHNFFTDGQSGDSHCEESGGVGVGNQPDGLSCMSVGNSTAAIYGLYDYPGADSPEMNWTLTQTVDGKDFKVRMRVPNPKYHFDGRHLWVHEPNNEYNREALNAYYNGKNIDRPDHHHLGGVYEDEPTQHWFRLPPIISRGIRPHTLLESKLITQWWGDGDKMPEWMLPSQSNNPRHPSLITARKRAEGFARALSGDSVAHGPEDARDGLMFGFNISRAHLLYPQYPGSHKELKPEIGAPMQSNTLGWMQWPRWRAAYDTTAKRDAHTTRPPNLARTLLDFDAIPTDETQQRRYYLGLTTTPPPAPLPAAAVQSSPAPAQVSAQASTSAAPSDAHLAPEREATEELERAEPTTSDAPTGSADVDLQNEAQVRRERQATMEVDYGVPGMDLTDTINQEYEAQDISKDKKITGPLPDMDKPTLEQGMEKRNDREQNRHWSSSRHQPWTHSDIYEPAKLELRTRPMDEAGIDRYRQRYGSEANLYLTNENIPIEILSIDNAWGWVRQDIWNSRLDTPDELHMRNLAKILCIYYDSSGVGEQVQFDDQEKRDGMDYGLYCHKTTAQTPYAEPVPGNKINKRHSSTVQIFSPVFGTPPKLSKKAEACLKKYCFMRNISEWDALEKCMKADGVWHELRKIKAPMLVSEWVTTPWHYEYLPYRRQHAVFRDGETYSEGCLRCARKFHDYEYMLAADRHTNKDAKHWPQTFWHRARIPKNPHCRLAPLPFHSPELWSDGDWASVPQYLSADRVSGGRTPDPAQFAPSLRAAAVKEAARTSAQGRVAPAASLDPELQHGQGDTMDWPAYQFTAERVHSKEYRLRKAAFGRQPPPRFRRYKNLAYSPSSDYTPIKQGRMRRSGKTKFCDSDYRLQRSHKYGNVCNDCAAVLDLAPGLFVRNQRFVLDAGIVRGNQERIASTPAQFWLGLQDRVGVSLDALHKRGYTLEEKDRASRAISDFFRRQHVYPTRPDGTPLTRLVSAPDIHVQKSCLEPWRDPELIRDAIRSLNHFLGGGQLSRAKRANPALHDILRHAERRYIHADTYQHIDPTKQFDSDVLRIELRDATVTVRGASVLVDGEPPLGTLSQLTQERLTHAGMGTWHNCLVTSSYKPKQTVMETEYSKRSIAKLQQEIRATLDADVQQQLSQEIDAIRQSAREAYTIDIYPCTRKGRKGEGTEVPVPTQWRGDGYVTTYGAPHWVERPHKPLRQTRPMRQSRLFVTYSLHRPVTSESQGRLVLERMADACYELFGNDKWLSRLLVFGQIIRPFVVGSQKGDNVSKSFFDVIDHTNKTDAMKDFYGSREEQNSSYLYDSYETHVDRVEVDGGVEIGPKMKHPHFHMLLTINHFSYVQLDYFKMNAYLEIMFRGIEAGYGWGQRFFLDAGDGTCFYGDNENPYVDIRVYPQDNWKEVLAAYVRKNAVPSMMEAVGARGAMPGSAQWRRDVASAS